MTPQAKKAYEAWAVRQSAKVAAFGPRPTFRSAFFAGWIACQQAKKVKAGKWS